MEKFGRKFNEALEECCLDILGCENRMFINELRSFFLDDEHHFIKKDWMERFVKKNHTEKNNLNLENYCMIRDSPSIRIPSIPTKAGYSNKKIKDGQNPDSMRYYGGMFDFVLFSEKKPLASIGFNSSDRGIEVRHIQGFKGASEWIKPLKWSEMCLSYVTDWAKRWDVPMVASPSVDNNYYAHRFYENAVRMDLLRYFYGKNVSFNEAKKMPVRRDLIERFMGGKNNERTRLTPHQGFLIYDVTAKNCGFTRESGNWVLRLKENKKADQD